MRSRSPANSADSSPPSPDFTSRTTSSRRAGRAARAARHSRVSSVRTCAASSSASAANAESSPASSRAAARSPAAARSSRRRRRPGRARRSGGRACGRAPGRRARRGRRGALQLRVLREQRVERRLVRSSLPPALLSSIGRPDTRTAPTGVARGRRRRGATSWLGGALAVPRLEPGHTAAGVDDPLLARVERVAGGADLDGDVAAGLRCCGW